MIATALSLPLKSIYSYHKYIPKLSTWEEARKSPVGDMVRLTAAASTKKQSTRLSKRQKGKSENKTKSKRLVGDSLQHLKEMTIIANIYKSR